jgi:hypothetical protein
MKLRALRAIATLALTAACWLVWTITPDALERLGLGALDIPTRVLVVFLFLGLTEIAFTRGISHFTRP